MKIYLTDEANEFRTEFSKEEIDYFNRLLKETRDGSLHLNITDNGNDITDGY